MLDGSGFCYHHHPELKEKRGKSNLGRHIPRLGLENMKEAQGLLFYSLETDQPLLTLRALTKIVSLHRLERLAKGESAFAAEPPALEAGPGKGRKRKGKRRHKKTALRQPV